MFLLKLVQIFSLILFFTKDSYSYSIKVANDNKIQESPKIYNWQVTRIVDGDTLEIANEFLPQELKLFIRLKNIDTPEKSPRSKCEKENILAQKATDFTKKTIESAQIKKQKITFSEIKWDKYGGRILARVRVGEVDLSQELVRRGLAREYFGDKKKGWCQ